MLMLRKHFHCSWRNGRIYYNEMGSGMKIGKGGTWLKAIRICLLLALMALLSPLCSTAGEYAEVTPSYAVKLPRDFYYKKDYKIQWWYFTGHLFDAQGREFGYELTFFTVGIQRRVYKSKFGLDNIYISHFAVSDVGGRKFYFTDRADRGAFAFAGASPGRLKVWVGKSILDGTPRQMHIQASDKEIALDLILTPEKPLVLNGENGYSRKSEDSPENASIYFTYPDLRTRGTLRTGGDTVSVSGKSWFDREFSSKELSKRQAGWDWFAIQLDDGRDIMLYVLRNKDGTIDPFSSGTFIHRNGTYRKLSKNDYSVIAEGHYKSKTTGARYPSKWKVSIPSEGVSVTITPLIQDQEVVSVYSTGNYYWEGACKVEGTAQGRAYAELTGY